MAPEMAPKAKFSKNKFIFVFSAHKAFPTIYKHDYTLKMLSFWCFWAWPGGTGRAFPVKFILVLKPSHYHKELVCEV